MQSKKRIVSGIQPTGDLHIGNYVGMISNSLTLQRDHSCFFFIVDLHSLTKSFTPKEKSRQILETATDMLALGFDPMKSTLFIQSHIVEHLELSWIFNCLTSYAELLRMTQFKDKSEHDPKNINAGLFNYPILQAADILLYKPLGVPVGKDQTQHLELTRAIAKKFNKQFSDTFPIIKPLFTDIPVLKSLIHPEKKMSKSHGPKSYIALHDEPDVIKKKLAKAVTGDKNSPGSKNLLILLKQFAPEEHAEFSKMKNILYKDLKEVLGNKIADYFADYREKKKELLKKPDTVLKVFDEGAKKAQVVARDTIKEVKEKIGLI